MTQQFSVLLTKSNRIANAISSSSVTHREAFLAYFSVFQPAVSYVLPLTTFTPAQCHRLQVKPTQLFLQKCGFVSNMHRSIVFAARQSGGLGFHHPYTEQGIAHLMKLIQTLRTPGYTRQLLLLAIHEWQISSGMSFSLLKYPAKSCPHLEGQWLLSTRQFLATIDGSVDMDTSFSLSLQRENDIHIMDALVAATAFSTERMKRLNYCRLHLQVTLLSEITDSCGTKLLPHFWCGSGPRAAPPLVRYPRQGCPSEKIWSEWRSAIRLTFCCPYTCRLRQPLGCWITPSTHRHHLSGRPISSLFPRVSWQDRLLCNVCHHLPYLTLRKRLYCSTHPISIICASDGGATNTNAAFGWVIRCGVTDLVSCYGPVDGYNPTSYRAECVGALSLMTFLSQLIPHRLTQAIPIYIDNTTLCSRIRQHQKRYYFSPSEATSPERDVLIQLESVLDSIPATLEFFHIKSHQDTNRSTAQLSIPAQANCRADALATRGLAITAHLSTAPVFDACGCQLHLHQCTITSHIPATIRRIVYESKLHKYICHSHKIESISCIDWSVFGRLCLRNSHRLRFFIKWIHRLLPTGKLVHRRNFRESPFCPACGNIEDQDHFLLCSHSTRKPGHIALISNLRRSLSMFPDPCLADILLSGVDSLFSGKPVDHRRYPHAYHSFCIHQTKVGWINLLRGLISAEWSYCPGPPVSQTSILKCLECCVKSVQCIWLARCDQRHSVTHNLHASELRRQACRDITDLYAVKQYVLPTDRHIFYKSLQRHLTHSTSDLRAWLRNHQSYIPHSVTLAQQLHVSHTSPITTYFHST